MDNQGHLYTSNPPVDSSPKKGGLSTILLLVFLIISIGASGYLFYKLNKVTKQNTDLKSLAVQLAVEKAELKLKEKVATQPVEEKTYINELFGFEFKYPSDYSIIDNLQTNLTTGGRPVKDTLSLKNSNNECEFVLLINQDGFGPEFPNKRFKLGYETGNGLYVIKTDVISDNINSSLYSLIGEEGNLNIGNVRGIWISGRCPNQTNNISYLDNLFNNLLSSFVINK